MFEKEAEEYAKDSFRAFVKGIREIAKIAFQKGIEFGYNNADEWQNPKLNGCCILPLEKFEENN